MADNMFDRIGEKIFGTERDVAPGRPPWPQERTGGAQAAQAPSREEPSPPAAMDTGRGPGGAPVERYGAREIEYPNPLPPNWRAELPPGADNTPQRPDPTDPGSAIVNRNPDRMTEPDHIEAQPRGGTSVASDDEAAFRPGPLPKKPGVTPAGKGGGGGRGGAEGHKALGDQTRRAAYDPDADKNDPRNIGVIDTKGNVNQQVYAASPMAHPEAYPKGSDQFTRGGQSPDMNVDQRDQKPATTGALQGAVEFVKNLFHQGQPDQHTNEGYVALTKGAVGAPDDDTMRSVFAVVDPNNQLDLKHRMELATRTGYDWYMHQGQPEKAQKFATDALQYGNKKAQSYGDQAMNEIKAGNRQGAIEQLKTGYTWLPDGYHADPTADGKTMEIHDGKGRVVQTIPLDDKSIQNLATGMATGTLYWDTVQHRAGVEQPFKPQPPPPTQAISAQPPQPSGAAPPVAAGPPPAPPGRQPMDEKPNAGPTTPVGVGAPPRAVPPPPPPPPPQQAAAQPAAATTGPAPPPAASPPPTQAMTPAPPPTLRPQPPAAAPPAAAPPPQPVPKPEIAGPQFNTPEAKAAAAPPPPPAPKPGEPPPEQKPGEPSKEGDKKPEITYVRPGNDPDAVPTHITDGKNTQSLEPHRYNTTAETAEVTRARDAVAQADAVYKKQQNEFIIPTRGKLDPKNKADAKAIATLNDYAKQAQKDHDETVARHNEVLRRNEHRQDQQDQIEIAQRKPEHLTGDELTDAKGKIDNEFKAVTDTKDKKDPKDQHPKLVSSPLRLEDKDGSKKAEMQRIALQLKAYNRNISPEEAARYTIEITSHVGTDQKGVNGQSGANGSRFNVVNKDLLGNPVIVIADDGKPVHLSIPEGTLNSVQRFKRNSFKVEEDKGKEANKKTAADAAAAALAAEQAAKGERTGIGAVILPSARVSDEAHKTDPVGSAVAEITGNVAAFTTPLGWGQLVAKYGSSAVEAAFAKLKMRPPQVEPPPQEPGQGKFVMPPPGT